MKKFREKERGDKGSELEKGREKEKEWGKKIEKEE